MKCIKEKKKEKEQEYAVERKSITTCRSRDLVFEILMSVIEVKVTVIICWGRSQETKSLPCYIHEN